MKRFLTLFVVLGAALLAAPGVIGYQVETYYQGLLAQIGKGGLEVISQEYRRSWFGAEGRTTFLLKLPVGSDRTETEAFRFTLSSQIDHGPLTVAGLGLARIQSEISAAGEAILPKDYQADINTLIEIGGRGITRIKLPAADVGAEGDRPAIHFEGMQGELQFDAAFEEVATQFSLPVLTLGDASRPLLQVAGISLHTRSSKGASGLMLGGGEFAIEKIGVKDPDGGTHVELAQLGIDAQSSAEADSVSAFVRYRVEKVQVDNQMYGPALLKLGFGNLSAAVLVEIQRAVEEINAQQLSDEKKGMALLSVLMGNASGLLKGNPVMTVDALSVQTPDGLIEGKLSLQAVDLEWKEITNVPVVLGKLIGDASLRIPEKILRILLQQKVQADLVRQFEQRRLVNPDSEMPTAEQLSIMSSNVVEQQLVLLLGQEFLSKEGDTIFTNVKLADGLLSVNGKTIPLPAPPQ